jgi:hypothetical protein
MNNQIVVLTYPDGKFVALDMPSGGYPYGITDIWKAQRWTNFRELAHYMEMFRGEKFVPVVYELRERARGIVSALATYEED